MCEVDDSVVAATTATSSLAGRKAAATAVGTTFPFRNFTVDHVIAQARGGGNHLDNLQLLCGACNSLKGDRDQTYLMAQLQARGHLAQA